MAIKAIIFDMEGVLMITRDKDLPTSWAKSLNAPYDAVREAFHSEMNDKSDLGEITQIEFDQYLIKTLGLGNDSVPIVRQVVDEQCFIDEIILEKIQELKKDYKIGLLSNYSKLMREKIENEWNIKHLFDDIIISCEVGVIKPDPAIFQLALSRLGVSASEAVLIDDRVKNIEGAHQFGLHAILFLSRDQALQDLDELLKTEK